MPPRTLFHPCALPATRVLLLSGVERRNRVHLECSYRLCCRRRAVGLIRCTPFGAPHAFLWVFAEHPTVCHPSKRLIWSRLSTALPVIRFRDLKSEYDALDCVVLGVSADGEASHKDFIADLGLNFSLLADTNK